MICLDALVALAAALRPADAERILSRLAGARAAETAARAAALARRPRLERASALATALRSGVDPPSTDAGRR